MSTTLETMISVLREKFKVAAPLTGATELNEVGLDSLDVINFLFSIEQAAGVKIPDEAIVEEKLETLADFARYIDARR